MVMPTQPGKKEIAIICDEILLIVISFGKISSLWKKEKFVKSLIKKLVLFASFNKKGRGSTKTKSATIIIILD